MSFSKSNSASSENKNSSSVDLLPTICSKLKFEVVVDDDLSFDSSKNDADTSGGGGGGKSAASKSNELDDRVGTGDSIELTVWERVAAAVSAVEMLWACTSTGVAANESGITAIERRRLSVVIVGVDMSEDGG